LTAEAATRLTGKVIVVTGAASGIGRATVLRLASEGAQVICVDRADCGDVEEAADRCGLRPLSLEGDVTSAEDLSAVAETVHERFGRIDGLFANAGVAGVGTAVEADDESWHRILEVNLTGAWRSAAAVLPVMVGRTSGSIVLQSSIGAVIGAPGLAAYSSAKAGLLGLMYSLIADYTEHNIRVNALLPGPVDTELMRSVRAARAERAPRDGSLQATPVTKLPGECRVDDVAAAAAFLLSDDARWITGTKLVVDGGATAV